MSSLTPDALQFLACLQGRRTFRTWDDRPERDPTLTHTLHDPGPQVLTDLVSRRLGVGIHVMLNEGDGVGHKSHNVQRVRGFQVEFRDRPLPSTWALTPTLLAEVYPKHYQACWLLKDDAVYPLDPDLYAAQQGVIVQTVAGQPFVGSSLNTVVRVPGFLNWESYPQAFSPKPISPASGASPQLYTVEEIESAFPLPAAVLPLPLSTGDGLTRFGVKTPRQNDYARRLLNREHHIVQGASGTTRMSALHDAAENMGRLVEAGYLSEATVIMSLTTAGRACGLSDPDLQQVIATGLTAGRARPASLAHLAAPERPLRRGQVTTATAARLVELIDMVGGEAWRDVNNDAHITVPVRDHWEHHRLDTRAARQCLEHLLYQRDRSTIRKSALDEVIARLQASAQFDGRVHPTAIRVAHVHGRTYVDLSNDDWEAVEIQPGGWRIITPEECPVRFVRPSGQKPLPVPVHGGHLTLLGQLLNVDGPGLTLCAAWLLGAVSGIPPYPLLCLNGGQGTGKSTASSVLRRLIDPHRADRRRLSEGGRDLFVAARNNHVLAFDNVSRISPGLSDALCTLSTGGGYAGRTLHRDSDETVLDATRPVILNGIPDFVTRPDLASRALTITLQPLASETRRPEAEFWHAFGEAHPFVLGSLLTALASGLSRLADTWLVDSPRMADFARLVVAAEGELPWPEGTFMTHYNAMRVDVDRDLLDDDPVAGAVVALLDEVGEWQGTVRDLRMLLNGRVRQHAHSPSTWPQTDRKLGEQLRRIAGPLSTQGYVVTQLDRGRHGCPYRLFVAERSD